MAVKAYELAADRYHDRPEVASEALYRAGLAYDKQAQTAAADFRSGKRSVIETLAELESVRAAADSLADAARYQRTIDEVTAHQVDKELERLGRGSEL